MENFEKRLKRKIIEFLAISDMVKELNSSLDLDPETIIDTFAHSIAGLFLINKLALVVRTSLEPVTHWSKVR